MNKFKVGDCIRHTKESDYWLWEITYMNNTHYWYKCLKSPYIDGRYENYTAESLITRLKHFNFVHKKQLKSNKPEWF